MSTTTDEIADGIYRISTFVPDANLSFNQILVDADEPFLFHTGMRALFPLVSEAVARVVPVERIRWISFGHVEADECGSLNQWLAAAPGAKVAFGALGCMVSVNDITDRPPRPLADGDVLDIGGKRLRYLATPHVPHGWEAGVFHEETTDTLLCGDLFTQMGQGPAVSHDSPMEGTVATEDAFGYSCLGPTTVPTVERLAGLDPTTLAAMHGPVHVGSGGTWLRDLAASYADRLAAAVAA
jgi:flavorubredoxin